MDEKQKQTIQQQKGSHMTHALYGIRFGFYGRCVGLISTNIMDVNFNGLAYTVLYRPIVLISHINQNNKLFQMFPHILSLNTSILFQHFKE